MICRLAPLSEGRILDGVLACNYHGWEFDRKGACLNNPQVLNVGCTILGFLLAFHASIIRPHLMGSVSTFSQHLCLVPVRILAAA